MKAPLLDIKHLVVPTDYSTPSIRALQYALRIAATYQAKVTVLNVDEDVTHAPAHCSASDVLKAQELDKQNKLKRLEEFIDPYTRELEVECLPRIEKVVLEGIAEDQIVDFAAQHEADVIVIATHGHTGFRRFVLGSTTKKVVSHAGCPVLVVRENERDFIQI